MNNKEVIRSWFYGRKGKSENMHTDGLSLFSYDLMIGSFVDGEPVIQDYTGEYNQSQTTARHVNLAAKITGATKVTPTT